jgi:putative ATP-dependent endonuclease of OLD family
LRTDNDIFKIPKKEEYRFAGIQRCISICRDYFQKDETTDNLLKENESNLQGFANPNPAEINSKSASIIIEDLERYKIYLSIKDLENDLFNTNIKDDLKDHFGDIDEVDIINEMQKRKASFMYDFLRSNKESLAKLAEDEIAKPLLICKELIEEMQKE